jgi:hypothetical protein
MGTTMPPAFRFVWSGLLAFTAAGGVIAAMPRAPRAQQPPAARVLFADSTPLAFTLTADFKAVQSDRAPNSTTTFPATIEFPSKTRSPNRMDLRIRTRGQVRRRSDVCDFAPLRLEFTGTDLNGTAFEGQHALKLGVHCRNVVEYESYPLREYAAYRIFNLLTPRSFRARLAKVTYIDTAASGSLGTHNGILIEDDDDVAKRLDGQVVAATEAARQVDREAFTLMTVFEYMIGNTDFSIGNDHNVKLVQLRDLSVLPVPYDFDYSGLVDTRYANPPAGKGLKTVRDRLYVGPCLSGAQLDRYFTKFRAIRPQLPGIYDAIPTLDPVIKTRALAYLDEFYRTIDAPDVVRTTFTESRYCLKSPGGPM